MSTTNETVRKRKEARNVGKNYALALKTGEDTHITLVYFNNVKRGFEQERVKQLADEFLDRNAFPRSLALQLGEMLTDRCVSVENAELAQLQRQLHEYFVALGYDLRPLVALHVDLRGQNDSAVEKTIETRRWNY